MLTREEAKQLILNASKEDTSSPKNCIHLLTFHKFLEKIYDEHEAEMKEAYIDGSNSTNELIQSLYKQIEAMDEEIQKLKAEKESLCKTIKDLQTANTHWRIYHKDTQ